MKILELRFKNLNSLYGEWKIDFGVPEYTSNGIFALTGSTGAGKTTILDAICLALYGATPRLGKITTSNEIMSRQTGECFSEVIFKSEKGVYKCFWGQHRARKKSDGNLIDAKHEISDVLTGKIIETKKSLVSGIIEDKTGMDFERFTRSILLAQGSFDTFLKADIEQKSKILEQITGTGIYTAISKKVNERNSEEKSKLNILEHSMNDVNILSEEDEKECCSLIEENAAEQNKLNEKYNKITESIQWLENIDKLNSEKQLLSKQQESYLKDKEDFLPHSKRLENAQKALNINADYQILSELKKNQREETEALQKLEIKLPDLQSCREQKSDFYKITESNLKEFNSYYQKESAKIKAVRELDTKLGEQSRALNALKTEIENITNSIAISKSNIKKSTDRLAKLKDEHGKVQIYFDKNKTDAGLLSEFTAAEQMFTALNEFIKLKSEAVVKKNKADIAFCKSTDALSLAEKAFNLANEDFQKADSDFIAIENRIKVKLNGSTINEFRDNLFKLKSTKQKYTEIKRVISEVVKTEKEIESKQLGRKNNEDKLQPVNELINSIETDLGKLEIKIESMEIQSKLQYRIKDLEEERKLLEDGKECPLCGAKHHPFAEGNIPFSADIDKQIAALKKEYKTKTENLENNRIEVGRLQTKIEEYSKSIIEYERKLRSLTDDYSEKASELQIKVKYDKLSISLTEIMNRLDENIKSQELIVKQLLEFDKQRLQFLDIKNKKEKNLHQKETELNSSLHQKEYATKAAEEAERLLSDVKRQYHNKRLEILERLSKYGEFTIAEENPAEVVELLRLRRDKWVEKELEQKKLEGQLAQINLDINGFESKLAELNSNHTERKNKKEHSDNEYNGLKEERLQLFGSMDTEQEEKKLHKKLEQLNTEKEKAFSELNSLSGKLEFHVSQIKQLKSSIANRADKITESEESFKEKILSNGFFDEKSFIEARLFHEEIKELIDTKNRLLNKETELKTLIKRNEDILQKELEKELTDESLETLNELREDVGNKLKDIMEFIGSLKNKLSENKRQKERLHDKIAEVEKQKKECARWHMLYELIGSSDGKKYRNFAQGLTFELMVSHANLQLGKMSDRYLLIRDKNSPLTLNVIDNYQGGEIRSTKNISGGESFIVSLSLALGLSKMASQKVRVDSLFLDEGFGTLDDEALETALETLSSIQQDGKLIGIISHVSALKERISTQITVSSISGGRSLIVGPGCKGVI